MAVDLAPLPIPADAAGFRLDAQAFCEHYRRGPDVLSPVRVEALHNRRESEDVALFLATETMPDSAREVSRKRR